MADVIVRSVLGDERLAPINPGAGYPWYSCPFCTYAVYVGEASPEHAKEATPAVNSRCGNPWCLANPAMPLDAARRIAQAAQEANDAAARRQRDQEAARRRIAEYAASQLVVVDEAQDMTNAKLKIARGICKKDGRMILVGDDRQAIYEFLGATADGLFKMAEELEATQLGLTMTYRCGKAIVALAAEMVPDFEAGPSNPAGLVSSLPEGKLADTAEPGDFILSRVNAPLVSTAMTLLRAGKRARVAGKDLGEELIKLVKRVGKSARSVPEFIERLSGWTSTQIARAREAGRSEEATEHMIEQILDKAAMLQNLADDARNVGEITERAEALFTDTGLGAIDVITLSSVHKAKGLEAERVFILAETLKNHTREEENIRYVAITRAKRELVWVGSLAPGQVPEPSEREGRR